MESEYQNLQSTVNEQNSQSEYGTITLVQACKKYNARQLWSLLGQVISSKFIGEVQMEEASLPLLNQENNPNNMINEEKKDININLESTDCQVCGNIGNLFELEPIKLIIELINHSKGSVELFRQKWLYVIDSGGQPQFHELLPTFVHHVSAAAFFVKLMDQ